MSPTAKAPATLQPTANDAAAPPTAAPSLVDNIPMHVQGRAPAQHNEDAELDKIMRDVGRELRKDDGPRKKHRFWETSRHPGQEANFSTQMGTGEAPRPAAAKPAPVSQQPPPRPAAPPAHNRVKAVAQNQPKSPKTAKPPKQHRAPVMVVLITILVTTALIAVAYRAYQ